MIMFAAVSEATLQAQKSSVTAASHSKYNISSFIGVILLNISAPRNKLGDTKKVSLSFSTEEWRTKSRCLDRQDSWRSLKENPTNKSEFSRDVVLTYKKNRQIAALQEWRIKPIYFALRSVIFSLIKHERSNGVEQGQTSFELYWHSAWFITRGFRAKT